MNKQEKINTIIWIVIFAIVSTLMCYALGWLAWLYFGKELPLAAKLFVGLAVGLCNISMPRSFGTVWTLGLAFSFIIQILVWTSVVNPPIFK